MSILNSAIFRCKLNKTTCNRFLSKSTTHFHPLYARTSTCAGVGGSRSSTFREKYLPIRIFYLYAQAMQNLYLRNLYANYVPSYVVGYVTVIKSFSLDILQYEAVDNTSLLTNLPTSLTLSRTVLSVSKGTSFPFLLFLTSRKRLCLRVMPLKYLLFSIL